MSNEIVIKKYETHPKIAIQIKKLIVDVLVEENRITIFKRSIFK